MTPKFIGRAPLDHAAVLEQKTKDTPKRKLLGDQINAEELCSKRTYNRVMRVSHMLIVHFVQFFT